MCAITLMFTSVFHHVTSDHSSRVPFYDVITSCVVISGGDRLIATGSLLSVNPNRIVAKRVVLSGHPFRINKKSATVRYMFFNRGELHECIVNPLSSI